MIGTTEIYDIPIGDYVGLPETAIYIVYSPLSDELILASEEDVLSIKRYLEEDAPVNDELKELIDEFLYKDIPTVAPVPDVTLFTKLSLLPNYTCNFACSYCYSSLGRSSQEIEWDKVKSTLDYFIDEHRIPLSPLSLFISGGGEPLVSWKTITRRTIEYAHSRAEQKGFPLHTSIITNGSLLTEEIASVLQKNHCSVCVSFEVLEDLQNIQRHYYDKVHKNIEMLGKIGLTTLLNSTITPLSVVRMVEMVRVVAERYPFVSQYTMEPVTGTEYFSSPQAIHDFYDSFYDNYLAAKKIAKETNINLRFTFDDALRDNVMRHCPGKFCLTPQGTISICHLVSSPKEERYAKCIYGLVGNNGRVQLNESQFKQLYNNNLFSSRKCDKCFARWSCGGECMTRNDTYPPEYMKEVCSFNRRFIRHLLIERIEQSVLEETGQTLKEYVRQ